MATYRNLSTYPGCLALPGLPGCLNALRHLFSPSLPRCSPKQAPTGHGFRDSRVLLLGATTHTYTLHTHTHTYTQTAISGHAKPKIGRTGCISATASVVIGLTFPRREGPIRIRGQRRHNGTHTLEVLSSSAAVPFVCPVSLPAYTEPLCRASPSQKHNLPHHPPPLQNPKAPLE